MLEDDESDYTLAMRIGLILLVLLSAVSATTPAAAERTPHELYDQYNALRLDPAAAYHIKPDSRIELRRGDAKLSFEEGTLQFFEALDGRVTGFVFSGYGHALAIPRDPVEKQQMARFLGAPILDQDFSEGYIRFTDETASEILGQLRAAGTGPQQSLASDAQMENSLKFLNPTQSLRLLFSTLDASHPSYFYAGLQGIGTGAFDVLVDTLRDEQFMLGQPKSSEAGRFYNVWTSYKLPNAEVWAPAFAAAGYTINGRVAADDRLVATATIRLRVLRDGGRMVPFLFSRGLQVDSVTDEQGERLPFFQNEGMTLQQSGGQGSDYLYVVLRSKARVGTEVVIQVQYHGNIIRNAGNGVLFVEARGIWYPHFGGSTDLADYDLTMRWPKKLHMVATGTKLGQSEDGDFLVGHWKTERPIGVAGFNLGEYASISVSSGNRTIDVYANRQLEENIQARLQHEAQSSGKRPSLSSGEERFGDLAPIPMPSASLKQLGAQIDASVRFYEKFSGPFPFRTLSVSQIPGNFGQGWPGLLYVSTYSFLPQEAQEKAGLSSTLQQHFTDLVPYHEVAHQWWGNVVTWSSYRDQWIDEAIANYLAVMFSDSQKNSDKALQRWLGRYRMQLLAPAIEANDHSGPAAEIGPLVAGTRLNSSLSPRGYDDTVYSKGTWVIHMLREMLKQPGAKDPDARFTVLLNTISKKYAFKPLTTVDFKREIESVMTPGMALEGGHSMDWFFDQWVSGTGIPHYHVEFSVEHSEKGYEIRGKLLQSGVPESFIARVPIFAGGIATRGAQLGVVTTSGAQTSFHFVAASAPHRLMIDPQMTLLCVSD